MGIGELAKMTDGGLKWDARAVVRFTGKAIEITNQDPFDWTHVTLRINATWDGTTFEPGYVLKTGRLARGRTFSADCSLFVDKAGQCFDTSRELPRTFWIECTGNGGIPGGFEGAWTH